MENRRRPRSPGPYSLKIFQAGPQILFSVGLQGNHRPAGDPCRNQMEQPGKVDAPSTQGQVFILNPAIVMQVELTQVGAQPVDPFFYGSLAEDSLMSAIQAEPHARGLLEALRYLRSSLDSSP